MDFKQSTETVVSNPTESATDELLRLAAEIEEAKGAIKISEPATPDSVEVEVPINHIPAEKVEEVMSAEAQAEAERIAANDAKGREYLADFARHIQDTGRMSYYGIVGDTDKLGRVNVPMKYTQYAGRTAVFIGAYYSCTKADKSLILKPVDYLLAYDEGVRYELEIIKADKEKGLVPPPHNLETFYTEHANDMLMNEREKGSAFNVYRVRDFSPEVAYELWQRIFPGSGYRAGLCEQDIIDMKESVRAFSAAALEAGDVETALEGYRRLDDMSNPMLLAKIKEVTTQLKESGKPEDRRRLNAIAEKIRANITVEAGK